MTPLVSLTELLTREGGEVEESVLGQLAWGPLGFLRLTQESGSNILVQGEWECFDLPASILISNLMLVKEQARPPCILVRDWKQLQLATKAQEVEISTSFLKKIIF